MIDSRHEMAGVVAHLRQQGGVRSTPYRLLARPCLGVLSSGRPQPIARSPRGQTLVRNAAADGRVRRIDQQNAHEDLPSSLAGRILGSETSAHFEATRFPPGPSDGTLDSPAVIRNRNRVRCTTLSFAPLNQLAQHRTGSTAPSRLAMLRSDAFLCSPRSRRRKDSLSQAAVPDQLLPCPLSLFSLPTLPPSVIIFPRETPRAKRRQVSCSLAGRTDVVRPKRVRRPWKSEGIYEHLDTFTLWRDALGRHLESTLLMS